MTVSPLRQRFTSLLGSGRTLALAGLLLTLATALPAQSLPRREVVRRVADSLVRAFLADTGAPSVAVAMIRGNDTLVLKGWGRADLEQDVAAVPRTVYRIGSVTKQFTAAAVMQLAEQGKLSLDDSIAAYLPALPATWRPVKVRQLLNHTSGIPSYTDIGEPWRRRWAEEMTPDTLVALTASLPMWFAPGTSWRYDNTGYVLLGMLVEKVAGRPWAVDIEERFAKPLGLADTKNCLTEPIVPRRARGYERQEKGWVNTPYLAMSQPYAAGALCSTVADLARWNRALHMGRVVSPASYALMTTPEGAAATGRAKYGFGLMRDSLGGRPVISHGGGIHGFISANAWIPGPDLSVTVLTNSGSARAEPLLKQLARAALGIPLERPPRVLALGATERARYIGVYALALPSGPADFTIAEQGDHLTAQLVGQGANPILYYGDHTFGVSFDPSLRLIFTVAGDRATKVTLVQGGGRFEGPRK